MACRFEMEFYHKKINSPEEYDKIARKAIKKGYAFNYSYGNARRTGFYWRVAKKCGVFTALNERKQLITSFITCRNKFEG